MKLVTSSRLDRICLNLCREVQEVVGLSCMEEQNKAVVSMQNAAVQSLAERPEAAQLQDGDAADEPPEMEEDVESAEALQSALEAFCQVSIFPETLKVLEQIAF